MAKVKFFNKGTARGKLSKAEIIKYGGGDTGKKAGKLLVVTVDSGKGNKVSGTMFGNESNPTKLEDIVEEFPVGSLVDISGGITEQVRESNGRDFIDRKMNVFSMRAMREDAKQGAFFIYQGIVESIKRKNDKVTITLRFEESYEAKNGDKKERIEKVTFVTTNEDTIESIDDMSVAKGDNIKIKGKILNTVEFDDYGDIIDRVQMYEIDKVEDHVAKDDIEEEDEDPDFL